MLLLSSKTENPLKPFPSDDRMAVMAMMCDDVPYAVSIQQHKQTLVFHSVQVRIRLPGKSGARTVIYK